MQRSRVITLVALPALACMALSACDSSSAASNTEGKLEIATTVAPITSIVANVGGDKVAITGIVPEGTNSHTFEPAPKVAATLSKADVVFINGLDLEDPTQELAEKNLKSGAEIVKLGNTVLPEDQWIYDFSFPKEDGKPNPHLWTDPTFAAKYAEVVKDTLVKRDAKNADYYTANYEAFVKQTEDLADAVRADQASVKKKELLTYHDAYAYFGRTFGWNIIGAVQPKNFEDPTPKEVASLIDQVKAEQVPTIFGSEVFPSKVLEEIGRATGARYEDTLRDDDLPGAPGEVEHSWLGLMKYDYVTMVKGLGGTPVELNKIVVKNIAPDESVYPQ